MGYKKKGNGLKDFFHVNLQMKTRCRGGVLIISFWVGKRPINYKKGYAVKLEIQSLENLIKSLVGIFSISIAVKPSSVKVLVISS